MTEPTKRIPLKATGAGPVEYGGNAVETICADPHADEPTPIFDSLVAEIESVRNVVVVASPYELIQADPDAFYDHHRERADRRARKSLRRRLLRRSR